MARSLEDVAREVIALIERDPIPAARVIHVYPLFGREHSVDGGAGECWCVPETRCEVNGVVVAVHRVVN